MIYVVEGRCVVVGDEVEEKEGKNEGLNTRGNQKVLAFFPVLESGQQKVTLLKNQSFLSPATLPNTITYFPAYPKSSQ